MFRRNTKEKFEFRLFISDCRLVHVDIWHRDLYPTDSKSRPVDDWVRCSLGDTDLDEFLEVKLNHKKNYEFVGYGIIEGTYDYFGEYDETLYLDEGGCKYQELSDEQFKSYFPNEIEGHYG